MIGVHDDGAPPKYIINKKKHTKALIFERKKNVIGVNDDGAPPCFPTVFGSLGFLLLRIVISVKWRRSSPSMFTRCIRTIVNAFSEYVFQNMCLGLLVPKINFLEVLFSPQNVCSGL